MAATSKRKLVLHMDVNNTVLIGDSLTKQISLEEVLNEYITGVIWGSVDENGTWRACDTSLHVKPPDSRPTEMICYHEFAEALFTRTGRPRSAFKKHIRNFTEEEAGKPFRMHYEQMQKHLRVAASHEQDQQRSIDEALIIKDSNGNMYHRIIPSFFELLSSLLENQRESTVVFRTFGGDGSIVLKGTALFLEGSHPCFPAPPNDVEIRLEPGVMNRSGESISLSVPNKLNSSAPREIYDYLTDSSGVQLVVDDFSWWKRQGFQQFAGKPLLLDLQDAFVHHIMFDDNIRVWAPQNSIVDVQIANSQEKHTFQRANPENWENVCIVKADLFQSICNKDYFIEKVQECEKSYLKFIENCKEPSSNN